MGGQVALGRKKRRHRQSASAFPPANIAPICTLHTTTQSPKGEHLIFLIWPRLHQFCKRERKWVLDLEETCFGQLEPPCFPNLKSTLQWRR